MYGFTESFNISVCAALCMYELTTRIRKTVPDYLLNEEERQEVYLNWLKTSVDKSNQLLDQHFQST
jgi:tRNA (guanosine-2'-O-)-methyltransferase